MGMRHRLQRQQTASPTRQSFRASAILGQLSTAREAVNEVSIAGNSCLVPLGSDVADRFLDEGRRASHAPDVRYLNQWKEAVALFQRCQVADPSQFGPLLRQMIGQFRQRPGRASIFRT